MARKYNYLIESAKTTANGLKNGLISKASFIYDLENERLDYLRESLRNELEKIERNTYGNPWVYDHCPILSEDQLCEHIKSFLEYAIHEHKNDTDPDEVILHFLTSYYLLIKLKDELSLTSTSTTKTNYTFEEIFVDAKHAKSVVDILKEYNYLDDNGIWTGETGKAVELGKLYLAVKQSKLLIESLKKEKFIIVAFCKGLGKTVAETKENNDIFATIKSIQPKEGDFIPKKYLPIIQMQTRFKELAKQLLPQK